MDEIKSIQPNQDPTRQNSFGINPANNANTNLELNADNAFDKSKNPPASLPNDANPNQPVQPISGVEILNQPTVAEPAKTVNFTSIEQKIETAPPSMIEPRLIGDDDGKIMTDMSSVDTKQVEVSAVNNYGSNKKIIIWVVAGVIIILAIVGGVFIAKNYFGQKGQPQQPQNQPTVSLPPVVADLAAPIDSIDLIQKDVAIFMSSTFENDLNKAVAETQKSL